MQVRAQTQGEENQGYWGALSSAVIETTTDGTPTPPINLRRTGRNETCVTLMWGTPIKPNGVINSYVVGLKIHKVELVTL